MPRYLIERRFEGGLEIDVADVVAHNVDDAVTWLHSYVSRDRTKVFDVYDAPSPEAIRRSAGRNRLPIDLITEVRVLEPYAFESGEGEPCAS